MSRQRCKICTHPELDAINSALMAGQQLKELAPKYGVTCSGLSRHKIRHLDIPATVNPNELAQEAEMWRARADQVWRQAEADSDTRAQIQSLVAGLRSLEFSIKQAEREASKPAPETEFKFRLEDIDNAVNKLFADCDRRTNLLAIDKSEILMPDCYQLFEKMLNDKALKQAVLRFAQNYEISQGDSKHVSQQQAN